MLPGSILSCTFIETPLFTASAAFLSDDDLRIAQTAIAANVRVGASIAETHGARKVRVRVRGRGKSGGARIIYIDNTERCAQVWLLLAYDKRVTDDLSTAGRKVLARIVKDVKSSPCVANPVVPLPN